MSSKLLLWSILVLIQISVDTYLRRDCLLQIVYIYIENKLLDSSYVTVPQLSCISFKLNPLSLSLFYP